MHAVQLGSGASKKEIGPRFRGPIST